MPLLDRPELRAVFAEPELPARLARFAVAEDDCRDILWSTTDGSLWHRLVRERGWTDERYADWLGELWVAQLVS